MAAMGQMNTAQAAFGRNGSFHNFQPALRDPFRSLGFAASPAASTSKRSYRI
jgi:hypothetical protein